MNATTSRFPVAVAIEKVRDGLHAGIVTRETSGLEKFYHLPFSRVPLRCDPLQPHLICIDPNISHERAYPVAALCRLIAKRYKQTGIPYSFKYSPDMLFNIGSGQFIKGSGNGLTCATFVLAVFQTMGLPLIIYETWPERPDDWTWQENMLKKIEKQPQTLSKDIEAAKSEIRSVRYRPEEVCGACNVRPLPANFDSARREADFLLEKLKAL